MEGIFLLTDLMSDGQFLIGITIASIILFLIGIRILLVFAFWAMLFAWYIPSFGIINMSIASYESLNSFAWVAIPVFVIVGALVNEFEMSSDIIALTKSIAGWLPGTIGNTAIYTAGVFSAITGSNAATTASVGEALQKDLENEGYKPTFAAATIASGGTLGIIIPPSVLFILYGVYFNISVPALFLAGVVPGIAMMLALSVVCTYKAYRHGYGVDESYEFDPKNVVLAMWRAKHAMLTIVILLGGIFAGIFTPSEAAGAAFAYIVITGIATARFADFSQLFRGLGSGVALTGIIVPIYLTSVLVQQSLSHMGLQRVVADAIASLPSVWMIMVAMVVVMLLTGMVLDSLPNMIITAPLLAPVATEVVGLHPITWAVVFMISDAIGFITPPYGLNLYVISSFTGYEYMKIAYAALPYLFVLIVIWIFFFIFPEANFLAPV